MTFQPQLIDNTAPGESLRSGATKINENFANLASVVNNIALATEGVAGEYIAQYQLVYVDAGEYRVATCDSSASEASVVGIAQENILENGSGLIQFGQSIVTNPEWSFSAGDVLFLGVNGAITNDASLASFVVPVGFAVTATSILFNLQSGFTHSLDGGTL